VVGLTSRLSGAARPAPPGLVHAYAQGVRRYRVVDVFSDTSYLGNPVAVVLDGEGLSTEQMQRLAAWTNLSETTFVLSPRSAEAAYRVRIFTPVAELPFAGHPTLGTCHAWLQAGGGAGPNHEVLQECDAGLVRVRAREGPLAFAAPPLLREGPVEEPLLLHIAAVLNIEREAIVDAEWVDNGPGWVAVMLSDAEAVLAMRPGFVDLDLGVVGPYPAGAAAAFEVRAFFPKDGTTVEDPVTGSLNASLAPWLLRSGRVTVPYVVSQGTVLGRRGRVRVDRDADGTVWVGGATVTCVVGEIDA
jgi:PhzF family phenazine biosynthesis protein